MELGEKLRLARLEAGLSQRQLCAEVITRNMLSQIENGSAKPSMDTLRYLAAKLGKSVSFFLEEDTISTLNGKVIEKARTAYLGKDGAAILAALEAYRSPDGVFDEEWKLLTIHACLWEAEKALDSGREIYAEELLSQAQDTARSALYATEEISGKILLLKSKMKSADLCEICGQLPSLDEELMLRAKHAWKRREFVRCLHLLESVEEKREAQWHFLRGELYLTEKDYAQAAKCFHQAEETLGQPVFAKLETCYREMENFQMAYQYACKQKIR